MNVFGFKKRKKNFKKILRERKAEKSKKDRKYDKIKAFSVNDVWTIDLLDLNANWSKLRKKSVKVGDKLEQKNTRLNRSAKYIMILIDIYSRYAWGFLLKNKKGITKIPKTISVPKNHIWNNAVEPLVWLIRKYRPSNLNSDGESAWRGRAIKAFFRENKIVRHIALPEIDGVQGAHRKQGISERFNRTLRNAYGDFWEEFSDDIQEGNFAYEKNGKTLLQTILDNYNSKIHSTTKKSPKKVFESRNSTRQIPVVQGETNKFLKSHKDQLILSEMF